MVGGSGDGAHEARVRRGADGPHDERVPDGRVPAAGPLAGLRVVELAGIGPAPYGCMLLADLGADVVCVDRLRPGLQVAAPRFDLLRRGRRSVVVDLKQQAGRDLVLRLAERADAFVEGFRPGVAERLGVGPDVCLARNPRLVYARMTGWGQDGPLAARAGHDLTYAAVAGALAHVGRADAPPTPPLNLVADFGGGALFLVTGVLAGVLSARATGVGQVVDVAMVDGVASLMTMFAGMAAAGAWDLGRRGANLLDSGLPTYDVYATADDGWMAVAPLEPQFWAALRERLGLLDVPADAPADPAAWPALRERLAAIFRTRTRAAWTALFADSDACVAPVLRLDEAPDHPHLRQRGTFVTVDGIVQPAPAPRFGATPAGEPRPPRAPGADTDAVLAELGLDEAETARLRAAGVVA